jgi:Helix-turn-helix domain
MKRAAELFTFTNRASWSTLVDTVWETETADEAMFMSVADAHWGLVVTREAGDLRVEVRGPNAAAAPAPVPRDAEIFGIVFSLGTYMPEVDLRGLVGQGLPLPQVSDTVFRLDGSAWELPRAHNADVFVERLARAGVLVHDPIVSQAVDDGVGGLSTRTVERRVARATGLTRGAIRQIHRAQLAVELLDQGVPPLEAARRAGYTDQPHLTRSVKRFVGVTPAQVGGSG